MGICFKSRRWLVNKGLSVSRLAIGVLLHNRCITERPILILCTSPLSSLGVLFRATSSTCPFETRCNYRALFLVLSKLGIENNGTSTMLRVTIPAPIINCSFRCYADHG